MLRRTFVDRSIGSFLRTPVVAGFPTVRRGRSQNRIATATCPRLRPWRSRASTRRLPLCATWQQV